MYQTLLSLLVFLLFSACLPGQEYLVTINNISADKLRQGQGSVPYTSILHDQKGFIWTATLDGVNRFEGEKYKFFSREQLGLISGEVLRIFEDIHGEIWVLEGSSTLLQDINILEKSKIRIIDPASGEILTFSEKFGSHCPIMPNDIINIYQDKKNTIWISTKRGEIFSYDGKFIKKYDNGGKALIYWSYSSPDGNFWIFESNQFLKINGISGNVIKIKALPQVFSSKKEQYFFSYYLLFMDNSFSKTYVTILENGQTVKEFLAAYQVNSDIEIS